MPAKLPVTVESDGENLTYTTHDVSISGLFARTNEPQSARKLIPLEIQLLPSEQSIACEAVVVNSVSAELAEERGLIPGMGLELHRVEGKTRSLWERYVGLLLRAFEYGQASPGSDQDEQTAQTVRINAKDVSPLRRVLSSAAHAFGVFLFSELPVKLGQPVVLHAGSVEAQQSISGEVVRVVSKGPGRGFGARFLRPDEKPAEDGYEPQITLDVNDVSIDESDTAQEDDSCAS